MRCQDVGQQLAVYRELNSSQRERLREHLAECSSCAATLAAYEAQDQMLAALPALSPSPQLAAAVRARTVAQRRAAGWVSWRYVAVMVSLLLLFGTAWGTLRIAAEALPGDALYPVKQAAEQFRLALTLDLVARNHYQQQLAETRRKEVRALIQLRREARVEFQGDLAQTDDGVWLVDGLRVEVGAEVWAGAPPAIGSTVSVGAQAASGQLKAHRVRVLQPPVATPTPELSPTVEVRPSPTPTCTGTSTPVGGAPGVQPTARSTPASSMPGPSPEQQRAHTPGPAVQPSPTAGQGNPGGHPRLGQTPADQG